MERETRSSKYQYMILEVLCPEESWNNFTNQNSIDYALNPWRYDERLSNLEDQLREEFWILAKATCTPRQWECLTLYSQGYTQMEIADKLNVNQSSITKSLYGNTFYENGKRGKTYGGLVKKLKKAIAKHDKIQSILAQINDIQEEKL